MDSFASLESMVLFAAMARLNGVDGAGFRKRFYIRREVVGRLLRKKKVGVDSGLRRKPPR